MKKLQAILTECKMIDKLFGLREKQIRTALAAARNDIEQQETEAGIEYERYCQELGAEGTPSYRGVLNQMICCKNTIRRAQETRCMLDEIERDLDSDVDVETSK